MSVADTSPPPPPPSLGKLFWVFLVMGATSLGGGVVGYLRTGLVVRQRWLDFPTDAQGRRYQAGVFWAGEACALSFRRDVGIITNLSEFVPHILAE